MVSQNIPQIEAQPRDQLGSRHTARVRAAGQLPAVIYGHKQNPVHISFDKKQVTNLLHQHAHLIEVVIETKTEPCLVKSVQWDHLGSTILHLDLTRVDLTETVIVEVDLELTGDPVGLKESGAFLQHPMDQIEVSCLASQIPDSIKIDISSLNAGQSMTLADLKLPAGITITADPETIIASIHVVSEEEAEPLEAGAGAAEPEVISSKKETESKE